MSIFDTDTITTIDAVKRKEVAPSRKGRPL